MNIPRNEYPRPQLVRDSFINLNGSWDFEIDSGKSGIERRLFERKSLASKITVPFCPESELSGIGNKDFMQCVWYCRKIDIPDEWKNKRVILHFGAVDFHAIVYVNGKKATEHFGGYTPFSADITDFLKSEENYVTLCAFDDTRSPHQSSGKQSTRYESAGCHYTRTTGIWQTVWMEAVDKAHMKKIFFTPDVENGKIRARIILSPDACGMEIVLKTSFGAKATGEAKARVKGDFCELDIPLSEIVLWDIGAGNLYDAEILLCDGEKVVDSVSSYFGMRSVELTKKAFVLNGRKVFGRWVLDQGFYPDGIYTAPSDEALEKDILLSMELGFNGARLHEKVFEERFLYHADRLGYLVWGEYANWGMDISNFACYADFITEWREAMERDYSHPSLIGWCPLNETWDYDGRQQSCRLVGEIYRFTKSLDPTRPCIDTSGNYHVLTDIFDVHDYEQDPEKFKTYYEHTSEGVILDAIARSPERKDRQKYGGQPIFVSEYGGIRKAVDEHGWGYGQAPEDDEEFISRYKGLTDVLLDNPDILGFCYTQLYDVEQEQNGLLTYDRKYKLDPKIFFDINTRKAAIEE